MSNYIKKLFLIIFLLTSSFSVDAYISGVGASRCGLLLQNLEEYPEMENFYVSWMQGFTSGLDRVHSSVKADINSNSLLLAVKKRCEDEPTEYMFQAVDWVYNNKL